GVRGRRAVHGRRGHLRGEETQPVAGTLRVPRDLPRLHGAGVPVPLDGVPADLARPVRAVVGTGRLSRASAAGRARHPPAPVTRTRDRTQRDILGITTIWRRTMADVESFTLDHTAVKAPYVRL